MTASDPHGQSLSVVGRRVSKIDSYDKVAGLSRYVDDLRLPGMLVGRLVRSWLPHARVDHIRADDALRVTGVVDIITHENVREAAPRLAASFDPACHDFERETPFAAMPGDATLLGPVIRYVGDPVAAIAAESDAAADEAAALLDVDLAALPAVFDVENATSPGAPQLHEGAPRNIASVVQRRIGDVDAALSAAAAIVHSPFRTSKQKQAQLEPTTCIAQATHQGITVWSPHQSPHRARHTLARLFGLPLTDVRMIVPTVGGGFGKGDALTAEPYAVALALRTGRPVKLTYSRADDFVGTESRHPAVADLEAGVRADGSLCALRGHVLLDAGAYLSHSPRIANVLANQLYELYAVDAVDLVVSVVFTNVPVSGAFRGYGGPQAAFMIEHLVDLGARAVGIDPIDARLRMLRRAERRNGLSRENVIACLERGREAIAARPTPPSGDGVSRGVGAACLIWKSGVADKPGSLDRSGAVVRVNEDASVDVVSAACDLGTGISTTLAQIVAETLSLPVGSVRVSPTDTAVTPFDSGAFSSRSLYRTGQAVKAAADEARRKILEFGATVLEAPVDDLDMTNGVLSVRGAPATGLPLTELLHRGLMSGADFHGAGEAPMTTARPAAAQFVEVAVDRTTGQATVVRLVAVQEVGRAVNPTLVEGQIEGGAFQGLGYALTEELVVDPDTGALLTGTFMDYRMPTASDGPRIETIILEMPDASGPYGAKGVGEPSIILPAPAVANAILDAIGVAPTTLPMTPERVFGVLRD
jgi:xanthine dehydrogenase molybdenum-binding subunit